MLTPIEWWGGVIFLLWAVPYGIFLRSEDKEAGFDWGRLFGHLYYLLPAVALAGYFYALDRPWLRHAYVGLVAVSLILCVVGLVQEVLDLRKPEAKDGSPGKDEEEDEDEEVGPVMLAVGLLIANAPVMVASGLGCYKAWPMVQQMLQR